MPLTRFKICCIASVEEAKRAIAAGASAIGLVSAMPSGPGPIPDSLIAEIAASVPPGVATFLLTSLTDADAIIQQIRACGVNTVQIVDAVHPSAYASIRAELPTIKIVQVIHVEDELAIAEAAAIASLVDAILLDSGRPKLAVKELGGTGRRHDWSVSRRLVERVSVPVFLAGGLNAANAAEAIQTVCPWALDICSGVRTEGRLDPIKLSHFVDAIASCA